MTIHPDRSLIISESDLNLNVSRSNNPFITTVQRQGSQDNYISPHPRRSHVLIKSVDKSSRNSMAEYSESQDFDDFEEEDDDEDEMRVNARKMPLFQSICKEMYRKPQKETYSNLGNSSMYGSTKGSFAIRNSYSSKKRPGPKDSVHLSISAKPFIKKNHLKSRKTIFLDRNNKITNKSRSSRKGSNAQNSNHASNIPGVVFESNGPSQKCMWDEINRFNENESISELNIPSSPIVLYNRMKSPAVIHELNKVMANSNRHRIKKNHKKVKSI